MELLIGRAYECALMASHFALISALGFTPLVLEMNSLQGCYSFRLKGCLLYSSVVLQTASPLYPLSWGVISDQEIVLFLSLLGLGIANCVNSTSLALQSSRESSTLLVNTIINHGAVCLVDHLAHLSILLQLEVMKTSLTFFLSSMLSRMPSMTSQAV